MRIARVPPGSRSVSKGGCADRTPPTHHAVHPATSTTHNAHPPPPRNMRAGGFSAPLLCDTMAPECPFRQLLRTHFHRPGRGTLRNSGTAGTSYASARHSGPRLSLVRPGRRREVRPEAVQGSHRRRSRRLVRPGFDAVAATDLPPGNPRRGRRVRMSSCVAAKPSHPDFVSCQGRTDHRGEHPWRPST